MKITDKPLKSLGKKLKLFLKQSVIRRTIVIIEVQNINRVWSIWIAIESIKYSDKVKMVRKNLNKLERSVNVWYQVSSWRIEMFI